VREDRAGLAGRNGVRFDDGQGSFQDFCLHQQFVICDL
jgi:hypothetical protein